MIISRTPYRISFFGGGTDYPEWYRQHGGTVLSATIDKYCYLTCRHLPPFFDHRIRIVYSKIESCQSITEIEHPSVREVLKYLGFDRGLEIHHDGDLPARSGMGSSSAFTVGLLNAIHALMGNMAGRYQLAMEAIDIEQNIIQEMVGSQDQVAAAFGGLNHVRFYENGQINVRPVTVKRERINHLNVHLMLFYTGIKRTASSVASSYDFESSRRHLRIMKDLVKESMSILNGTQDLSGFGSLLHEAWLAKKSLSAKVSNSEVDQMYQAAVDAGALGGKITGAGGGGFMLLFVPPDRQPAVKETFKKLINVPFRFEFMGSQIVFFDPSDEYSEVEKDRKQQSISRFKELDDMDHEEFLSPAPLGQG